jgi:hypothetical protein
MSALGTALGIVVTKVRARALARRLAATTPPHTPVAVYFADAPFGLYQLRRWFKPLEALDATHRVSIITSDPATYALVRAQTSVAVTFADGAAPLGRVFQSQGVKVVLYPNNNTLNFRALRFSEPVHVFIGHGESAKESSVSRQLNAYDFTFVASRDAIEQLRGIRGFDADASAVVIGSPWLDFLGQPPSSWHPDHRRVVLYAPTWEGDRPTMDYSSVETLGLPIVEAILGMPTVRLIYRPHPWIGRVRSASVVADARIRSAINKAGRGDVIDTGEYGWALGAAQLCITDISSVVFDARALGKGLMITVPDGGSTPPVPQSVYAGAVRLELTDVAGIRLLVESALSDTANRSSAAATSMNAMLHAIEKLLANSGEAAQ